MTHNNDKMDIQFMLDKNDQITLGISLVLILYSVFVVPKLSPTTLSFFDNAIVKMILFILIVYISRFNATLALITTIAVIASLMKLNENKTQLEKMTNKIKSEYSENNKRIQLNDEFSPENLEFLKCSGREPSTFKSVKGFNDDGEEDYAKASFGM